MEASCVVEYVINFLVVDKKFSKSVNTVLDDCQMRIIRGFQAEAGLSAAKRDTEMRCVKSQSSSYFMSANEHDNC